MSKSLAAAVLLCVAALSFSEAAKAPASDPLPYPGGLGFSFGNFFAGSSTQTAVPLAISLRRWEGTFGWQAAAGIMYLPAAQSATGVCFDYYVGVEGLWSLFSAQFSDWFFNQLFVFADLTHRGFVPWVVQQDYTAVMGAFHPTFGLGVGVGIEFGLFQHFSTTFEAGYGVFWDPAAGAAIAQQLSVPIIGQMTLHYRF